MSRTWRAIGAVVALAGLGLAAWGLWWIPPAGQAPAEEIEPLQPRAGTAPSPALVASIEAQRVALEACLGQWRLASPDAPDRVRLAVTVQEDDEAASWSVQVAVEGGAPGRMVLETCAEAALEAAGVTDPAAGSDGLGTVSIVVGGGAG